MALRHALHVRSAEQDSSDIHTVGVEVEVEVEVEVVEVEVEVEVGVVVVDEVAVADAIVALDSTALMVMFAPSPMG
jgi:hypothetical protein